MRMPLLLLVMLPLAVGSAGRSRATDDSGPVQAVLGSIARDLTGQLGRRAHPVRLSPDPGLRVRLGAASRIHVA